MATIEERLQDQPKRLVILAACAFARTVEHLLKDERSRAAIEVAERFADGQATDEEVAAAVGAAGAAAFVPAKAAEAAQGKAGAAAPEAQAAAVGVAHAAQAEAWAAKAAAEAAATIQAEARITEALTEAQADALWVGHAAGEAQGSAAYAAEAAQAAPGEGVEVWTEAAWAATQAAKAAAHAKLHFILDCIFSLRIQAPFPAHVKGLARTIYDKQDWALMPILADAFEEMGLEEFVEHCRQTVHAKGCYVLDTILGLGFE